MCNGENCNSNLIVNVKYNLCDNCNSIRLHGKSKGERQALSVSKFRGKQQAKNSQRQTTVINTPKIIKEKKDRGLFVRNPLDKAPANRLYIPIKQQTSKEAGIKSKLSVLKGEIELHAVHNNEYYCRGCGHSHPGLDKSHILSVGMYKQYELIKENIQLMCRLCHTTWESGAIDQQLNLECFVDNVIWIYSIGEIESYNKFITRIEDLMENMAWLEHALFDKFSTKYHSIINNCGKL